MRDSYHKSSNENRDEDWTRARLTIAIGKSIMTIDISRLIQKWNLTISNCRALKSINSRRGRRKEFAIWYGNRELGPEVSRQAASRLRYHNDKFQEGKIAHATSRICDADIFGFTNCTAPPWDIADGVQPVWILQKQDANNLPRGTNENIALKTQLNFFIANDLMRREKLTLRKKKR